MDTNKKGGACAPFFIEMPLLSLKCYRNVNAMLGTDEDHDFK
jgi:hypothetical protein